MIKGRTCPIYPQPGAKPYSPPGRFWLELSEPVTSVPEAIVIMDEAGRSLETVSLATVLPEPVKKYGHLGWRPL